MRLRIIWGRPVLAAFLAVALCWSAAGAAEQAQTPAAKKSEERKKKREERKLVKEAAKQSPSFQQKKWTGTQAAYESYVEYDYIGRASQNLGEGHNRNIDENYLDLRHVFMRHT